MFEKKEGIKILTSQIQRKYNEISYQLEQEEEEKKQNGQKHEEDEDEESKGSDDEDEKVIK